MRPQNPTPVETPNPLNCNEMYGLSCDLFLFQFSAALRSAKNGKNCRIMPIVKGEELVFLQDHLSLIAERASASALTKKSRFFTLKILER